MKLTVLIFISIAFGILLFGSTRGSKVNGVKCNGQLVVSNDGGLSKAICMSKNPFLSGRIVTGGFIDIQYVAESGNVK